MNKTRRQAGGFKIIAQPTSMLQGPLQHLEIQFDPHLALLVVWSMNDESKSSNPLWPTWHSEWIGDLCQDCALFGVWWFILIHAHRPDGPSAGCLCFRAVPRFTYGTPETQMRGVDHLSENTMVMMASWLECSWNIRAKPRYAFHFMPDNMGPLIIYKTAESFIHLALWRRQVSPGHERIQVKVTLRAYMGRK